MKKLKIILFSLMMLLSLLMTAPAQAQAHAAAEEQVIHQRRKESTPLSQTQMLRALREAHIVVFGITPSRSRLASAWAQVALENGQGKVVWNYNLGNVGPSGDVDWYWHSPGVPYRAYGGFLEGGIAYWKVIDRCWPALKAFDLGQPKVAAERLKSCNYFGADLEPYIRGMVELYWYALGTVIPAEVEESHRAGQD